MTVRNVSEPNTIKVTACVLTLNEESFIEDCLSHLKPYVDYIIVLDGASDDKTVDIARRYAHAVIARALRGSFALERNYMQEMATTNWCLHCDADERFNKDFLRNIRQIIIESNVHCFRFPRINLDDTYPHPSDPKDHQVRLLDKRYGFWVRPVHEIVWSRHDNKKPLDQVSVKELPEYPIIHLARPKDTRKKIMRRWKWLEP